MSEAEIRDSSQAKTYTFHTNILRVSKSIRDEAEFELYHWNTFVLITFQWPDPSRIEDSWLGFRDLLNNHDVPIVVDDLEKIKRFKGYCMRIHMKHPACSSTKSKAPKTDGVVITAKAMSAFCSAIRWECNRLPLAVPLILRYRKSKSAELLSFPPDRKEKHYTMTVRFQHIKYLDTPKNTFNALATLLKDLRIAGMSVKQDPLENGFTMSTRKFEDAARVAGPSTVFLTALAWDMLDIAADMMAKANQYLRRGQSDLAMRWYQNIFQQFDKSPTFAVPWEAFTSDAHVPLTSLCRIVLDAIGTFGLECIRHRHHFETPAAARKCNRFIEYARSFVLGNEALGYTEPVFKEGDWYRDSGGYYFSILYGLMTARPGQLATPHPPLGGARIADELMNLRKLHPSSAHIEMDLELVNDLLQLDHVCFQSFWVDIAFANGNT